MAATVLRVGMLIGVRYMGSVLFCNIGVKDRVSWAVYCTMKFGAKDEDNCFLDPNWLASMVATVLKVGILVGVWE